MIVTVWLLSALMLSFIGFGFLEIIGMMCIAHFLTLIGIRIFAVLIMRRLARRLTA
jgi:hypothetical protein